MLATASKSFYKILNIGSMVFVFLMVSRGLCDPRDLASHKVMPRLRVPGNWQRVCGHPR